MSEQTLWNLFESAGLIFDNIPTPDDLEKYGYRKLKKEAIEKVSDLFEYAPQIISSQITEKAAKAAFHEAVNGSYRVILNPGLVLGNSHKTAGAFSGLAFDENGKLKDHAEWILNDAKFSLPQAQKLIASAFNAAAFITGQYFESQINSTLSTLSGNVTDITNYLDDERSSKISARVSSMERLAKHLDSILSDPLRRQNFAQDIEETKTFADEQIDFARRQIDRIKENGSSSDSDLAIEKNFQMIVKRFVIYRHAVAMFCQATLLGICLEKVTDINELNTYYEELSEKITEYEKYLKKGVDWMNNYINSLDRLNQRSFLQNVAAVGAGALRGGIPLLLFGRWGAVNGVSDYIETKKDIQEKFDHDIRKKKHNLVEKVNSDLALCYKTEQLYSAQRTLIGYISCARRVVVIKKDDDIYTNIPVHATSND